MGTLRALPVRNGGRWHATISTSTTTVGNHRPRKVCMQMHWSKTYACYVVKHSPSRLGASICVNGQGSKRKSSSNSSRMVKKKLVYNIRSIKLWMYARIWVLERRADFLLKHSEEREAGEDHVGVMWCYSTDGTTDVRNLKRQYNNTPGNTRVHRSCCCCYCWWWCLTAAVVLYLDTTTTTSFFLVTIKPFPWASNY